MKCVFDTVTFWSCDSLFGAEYADRRTLECVVRVIETCIDPSREATFIFPKPATSAGSGRSAGPLPRAFSAFLDFGLLVEPKVAWSAEPEQDAAVLEERLHRFEELVRADAASIRAFARLHTHPYVGSGWLHRVDDYVVPKPPAYAPPSDPNDARLGIPKHLVDFLESKPGERTDRFREMAERVDATPWELRFAFSVLNRRGEDDGSVTREGNDEWTYVTHPLRQWFRTPCGEATPGLDVEWELSVGVLARYAAQIAQTLRPPLRASEFARGVAAIRGRHGEVREMAREFREVIDADVLAAMLDGSQEPHESDAVVGFLKRLRLLVYGAFDRPAPEMSLETLAEISALAGLIIAGVIGALASGQVGYVSAPLTIYNAVKPKAALYSRSVADSLAERKVRRVEANAVFPRMRWSCGTCGALLIEGASRCLSCGWTPGVEERARNLARRMRRILGGGE